MRGADRSPLQVYSLKESRCLLGGGYFFMYPRIPKITAQSRFKSARTSKTLMQSPPFGGTTCSYWRPYHTTAAILCQFPPPSGRLFSCQKLFHFVHLQSDLVSCKTVSLLRHVAAVSSFAIRKDDNAVPAIPGCGTEAANTTSTTTTGGSGGIGGTSGAKTSTTAATGPVVA